jgi:cobalt/nickel transport protein
MNATKFLATRLAAGLAACLLGTAAQAHFQMLYLQESALPRGQDLELALIFTHPFNGGPTMPMRTPRSFTLVSQRGSAEDVRTDLRKYLRPVQWQGADYRAAAYRATIPRDLVRSLGDHVFVLEPEPYLDVDEDIYIQQFTKLVVNVGGVPGNWADSQKLPVEIQPLSRPYANWTGGVFRGVVLSDGNPVPFAKIELEYVNHPVDLEKNTFGQKPATTAPSPAYERMSLLSDEHGQFVVGLPRAGWWGIAALDVGKTKTHEGKTLSQDAVLWLQVKDMK